MLFKVVLDEAKSLVCHIVNAVQNNGLYISCHVIFFLSVCFIYI